MVAEVEERYTCKRGGSYKQLNPLAIFRHFSGTPGPSGFGASTTARGVLENWVGKGKVAVVTGPYSGIGLATARELARKGCEVVLAGRKKAGRGEEWVEREILSANANAKVTQIDLDLTSLASVRHFASEFRKSGKDLNILVNNAGVMAVPFSRSKEGHELQFATNHLGHFLLTSLLLDRMKESARKRGAPQGRIVNVSSSAHYMSYRNKFLLEENEIDDPAKYQEWRAYGQSKLCNVLHARELDARLREEEGGKASSSRSLVAVAVHPGVIITELQSHLEVPRPVRAVAELALRPFLKSIDQGAATTVFAATAPAGQVNGGEFYYDCNEQGSAEESKRRGPGRRLWRMSEKFCAGFF